LVDPGAAYRPAVGEYPGKRAGLGRCDRSIRDWTAAARRRQFARRIFSRAHRLRLGRRTFVSAHAVRARHGAKFRIAIRGRRPGIWIGMAMHHSTIKSEVRKLIANGTVLPAHPLALDAGRALDVRHQRALTRYYIDAGAGGLAVGVHTTQFAIRDVG